MFQKLQKHASETKDSIKTSLKPSTAPRLQSKALRHKLSDNYLTRWMEKQRANKKAGKPSKTIRPWPHSSFSDHNREMKNKVGCFRLKHIVNCDLLRLVLPTRFQVAAHFH